MLHGGWLVLAPTFSEDNNANILGLADDSRNQICAKQDAPRAIFGPAEQYLSNLIAARKIDDCLGGIIAFQDPRFNVQIPGKVQVRLDRIDAFVCAMVAPGRRHTNRKAIGAKVIGHSAAAPNEHGRRRVRQ